MCHHTSARDLASRTSRRLIYCTIRRARRTSHNAQRTTLQIQINKIYKIYGILIFVYESRPVYNNSKLSGCAIYATVYLDYLVVLYNQLDSLVFVLSCVVVCWCARVWHAWRVTRTTTFTFSILIPVHSYRLLILQLKLLRVYFLCTRRLPYELTSYRSYYRVRVD